MLALDLHRARTWVGGPESRRCMRVGCRQLAVRGVDFCRHHGGGPTVRARKAGDPFYKPKRSTMLRNEIKRALKLGLIPHDLLIQPIFLEVMNMVQNRVTDEDYPGNTAQQRRNMWMGAGYLVLEFMNAWDAMLIQDHGPWHNALAKASSLGFTGAGFRRPDVYR